MSADDRREAGRRIADLFRIEAEPAHDKAAVRRAVATGAQLSVSYLLMNAAATLIAGYGLLSDSEAVVIGAMLVAMLYGPILGISLALAEADTHLLGRAIVAEVVGALWVLSIGTALGWIHQEVPIGEQVLARTAPNILDLMIALVGGAAGAYATVSPRISGAVVGVAIATALCPPLTACGILLAHGLPHLAGGAALLFFANLSAIAGGAMLVFLLSGHRAILDGVAGHVTWTARLVPIGVMAVLGTNLVATFRATVEDSLLRSSIERALERALSNYPGARVVEVRIGHEADRPVAFAVIRTPSALGVADVSALDDAADRAAGRNVALHVRTILIEELTREGQLYTPNPSAVRARVGR